MGIMGHTQGVSSASSPPKKPIISRLHQPTWEDAGTAKSLLSMSTGVHSCEPVLLVAVATTGVCSGRGSASVVVSLASGTAGAPTVSSKFSDLGGWQVRSEQLM